MATDLVRALVGRGVLERGAGDSYRLTPQELHAWAETQHSLRTGEAAFPHHFGSSMFAWLAEQPAALAQFNDTMRRRTATMRDAALPAIDWRESGTVVDVGGGNGLLLERLLRTLEHPSDRDDEHASAIRSRVREAIGSSARLRVFDAVLLDESTYNLGPLLDLHMLVLLGAAERTKEAWASLLERNGFALERIVATPTLAWIEARAG